MTWTEYYGGRVGTSYPVYCTKRYQPFLDVIRSMNATNPVEEGCGVGTISKVLGIPRSFDLNSGMVGLSRLNGVAAVQKGITTHIECDLVISHGVIEHLPDETIFEVIGRGGRQVHYVPSAKYETPSFGDERLMQASEWKSKFNPSNIVEFNDGKDLVLIWTD